MTRKSLVSVLFIASLLLTGCASGRAGVLPAASAAGNDAASAVIEAEVQSPSTSMADLIPAEPEMESVKASEPAAVDPNSPRGVVEAFYGWYLKTARNGENILSLRSYRQSPYLSDYLIKTTDYLLDSFNNGAYDPFLCAQDTPYEMTVDGVFTSETGSRVLVRSDWEGHFLTVGLYQQGEDWLIDEIRCPASPADTAWAFYTWYLGYALHPHGMANGEISRNALADKAYRSSGFLSQRLVDEIDSLLTNQGGFNADPILGAQTTPLDFWVDAGPGDHEATVRLQYGPQSARYARLVMETTGSFWKIDQIHFDEIPAFDPAGAEMVDTSNWQELKDEQLGFSLRFPQGWVSEDADLSANPADDTMQRSIYLMPAADASKIQAQKAAPDPSMPAVVPTLYLDVQRATAEQLAAYYPTDSRERVEWQGNVLWVEREPGVVRYVLQSPLNPDLWLVFIDRVSEYAGREAQAADLDGVLLPMLASVSFTGGQ